VNVACEPSEALFFDPWRRIALALQEQPMMQLSIPPRADAAAASSYRGEQLHYSRLVNLVRDQVCTLKLSTTFETSRSAPVQ
jgi:hypothetical protein